MGDGKTELALLGTDFQKFVKGWQHIYQLSGSAENSIEPNAEDLSGPGSSWRGKLDLGHDSKGLSAEAASN